MGYQFVDVEDSFGYHNNGTVFNGDLLMYDKEAPTVLSETLYSRVIQNCCLCDYKSLKITCPI